MPEELWGEWRGGQAAGGGGEGVGGRGGGEGVGRGGDGELSWEGRES